MVADAKNEAQVQGLKMIEQAKAAIESEKNAAMAELKLQVSTLSLSIAEKILKDELSNKAQTKLVEKMLGDVVKLTIMASTRAAIRYAKAILDLANSRCCRSCK
jgi:F0F1-type ATP synthase membrane subunit b/b'